MTLGVGFCSIELGVKAGKPPTRILLAQEGDPGWPGYEGITMDAEQGETIIAAFETQGVDVVIDYEHATTAVDRGERAKAPAAGWVKGLKYVQGKGLYADPVEWNEGAIEEIKSREYKYFSPVIAYDVETLKMYKLHSVALTNKPRTIGQRELLAAARAILDIHKENDVPKDKNKKLIVEIAKDQGVLAFLQAQEDLPEDAPAMSADQAAIGKLLALVNEKEAGLPDNATLAMIIQAAIDILGGGSEEEAPQEEPASLKEIGARLGTKDGKKESILAAIDSIRATTVSGKDHQALQERMAGLEKKETERMVEAKIEGYVSTGQLNPNDDKKMEWAKECCGRSPDDFDTLMAGAPKIWDPETKTVGNSGGPKTGREAMIAGAVKMWEGSDRDVKCWAFVNAKLGVDGAESMSTVEREKLAVLVGK